MRFCIQKGKRKILMAQKLTDDKKEIPQDPDGDDLPPPPYCMMMRPPPMLRWSHANAPSRARWRSCGSRRSSASSPGDSRATISAGSIPVMEASGQCHQDATPAGPPTVYPLLPLSTDGKGGENTGIRQRPAPPGNRGEEPHYRCPSESYYGLWFRTRGALPSAPCSLLLPAIFLHGYIILAETHSSILWGGHNP